MQVKYYKVSIPLSAYRVITRYNIRLIMILKAQVEYGQVQMYVISPVADSDRWHVPTSLSFRCPV